MFVHPDILFTIAGDGAKKAALEARARTERLAIALSCWITFRGRWERRGKKS